MIEVNQEFILPTYPAKGGQAFGEDRITIGEWVMHLCEFNKKMKD